MAARKENISFRKKINANANEWLESRIKDDGTIVELKVKFYAGQQKSLKIEPFVEYHGEQIMPLLIYPNNTERYLSGDDDYLVFSLDIPVGNDDLIKVHVTNTDDTYAYDLVVDITVDYHGGKERS